jgi:hypothetical protein
VRVRAVVAEQPFDWAVADCDDGRDVLLHAGWKRRKRFSALHEGDAGEKERGGERTVECLDWGTPSSVGGGGGGGGKGKAPGEQKVVASAQHFVRTCSKKNFVPTKRHDPGTRCGKRVCIRRSRNGYQNEPKGPEIQKPNAETAVKRRKSNPSAQVMDEIMRRVVDEARMTVVREEAGPVSERYEPWSRVVLLLFPGTRSYTRSSND